MVSTAQVMGPACVAAWREPFVLPEHVLNTMAEARVVSVVLSFLQGMLDKQRSSSTIKVYAPIVYAPIAGRSVGRDSAVIKFFTRRQDSESPASSYSSTLGLTNHTPFESLHSSSLRVLSLKTALLLALASVKRLGDLQALYVNPACLELRPNDSKVILKPRLGYVPKVLSTQFRAQVIALSTLPYSTQFKWNIEREHTRLLS